METKENLEVYYNHHSNHQFNIIATTSIPQKFHSQFKLYGDDELRGNRAAIQDEQLARSAAFDAMHSDMQLRIRNAVHNCEVLHEDIMLREELR